LENETTARNYMFFDERNAAGGHYGQTLNSFMPDEFLSDAGGSDKNDYCRAGSF